MVHVISSSGFLDKQTISGVHGMPQEEVKRYALGFLRGKELHLTSLKGIHRLRPSFEYLDCVGAGEKRSMQCMQEGGCGSGWVYLCGPGWVWSWVGVPLWS